MKHEDTDGDRSLPVTTRRGVLTATAGGVLGATPSPTTATTAIPQQDDRFQWIFQTGDTVFGPTVVDDTVFFGSNDNTLYALDTDTGNQQWTFETSGTPLTPTVVDGVVFTADIGTGLYALDADTGTQQWDFEFPAYSAPTVVDGTVFIGSKDDSLYAVDADTGTQQWVFETDHWVNNAPTVLDGTVFFGCSDSNLYAVDADTGTQEWAFEADLWFSSSPTVWKGTVFIGDDAGNLHAVNAANGTHYWSFGDTIDEGFGSPTVAGETVFVGSNNGNLYALNARGGAQQWGIEVGYTTSASPTVVGGTVFVGGDNLYSVDADTGTQQWTSKISPTSQVVVDGTVFVGSIDNNLYAVDADVSGSSDDSHMLLGTTNHHSGWKYAEQSINIPTTGSNTTGSNTTGSNTTGSNTTGSNTTGSNTTGSDRSLIRDNTALLAGGIGAIAGGSYLIQQWLKSTEQIEKDTSKTTNDDLTSDTAGANGQSTTAGEETRPEQQNEVINHLKLAERSLQEAIVAYIQADQTVARIRFRKARDIFKDAHKAIVESEADLLTEPVAVDAQLDRKLSSTTISGLPGIPETAATELTEAGIETVDDLDGGAKSSWTPAAVEELVDDEKIEKDIATTLTLLSWWHGDESYEFDTAEAVESRQQQADYGFNHSS